MTADRKRSSRFPPTRWSLVGRAGSPSEAGRHQALGDLLEIYAPALQAFLVRSLGVEPYFAQDILQDFITDKILARRILDRADPERGRFRNFLAKSLSRYALTKLGKENKQQERSVNIELADLEASSHQDTDCFDQEWIRVVVGDALALMEEDCRERGREDLWTILRLRAIDPILQGVEPVSYDRVVAELDLATPREAINLLVTAKRCFVRNLRTAVGRYVADPEQVEREIADLREIIWR